MAPSATRQRDIYPLPSFESVLPPRGDGVSSSAHRKSLQRDHIGKWCEEIGGVLNEMSGSRRSMHEGNVTTSQKCVLKHVLGCVDALGPPPVDDDGVRVPGRVALQELLAKQGYGGGATVSLDINLLSLPSLEGSPVALDELLGPGGNHFVSRSSSIRRCSQRMLHEAKLRLAVSGVLTWTRPFVRILPGMGGYWSGCGRPV